MYPINPDDLPQPQNRALYQASGLVDTFVVPTLKALFLGFCVGVLVGIFSALAHFPANPFLLFLIFWFIGMITFFIIFERRAWDLIKKICGADLKIILPEQPQKVNPNPLRIWKPTEEKKEGIGADFPEIPHRELLPLLADGLLSGRGFSQRQWPEISQPKFYQIQRAFIEGGLAQPTNGKSGNNGFELTEFGINTLRTIKLQAAKDRDNTALPYFPSA